MAETIERDDGFTTSGAGPEVYLSEFKGWPSAERQSVRFMRGPVLDVGCGAGRVALHLQQRGIDVVGLDSSPLAVQAARLRGVKEVWCLSMASLGLRIGSFDTIVMFGNNFGLFGTPERARRVLTVWASTNICREHESLWRRRAGVRSRVLPPEQRARRPARTGAFSLPLRLFGWFVVSMAFRIEK